ncbi:MAG: hypothetical protein AAF628_23735 [Planctomycetota bacterium]
MNTAPLYDDVVTLCATLIDQLEHTERSAPLSLQLQHCALQLLRHVALVMTRRDRAQLLDAADVELQALRAQLEVA